MTTLAPIAKPKPPRTKIRRPSSAATRWHMSGEAVDRGVSEYAGWTDLQCVRHLARVRWGDFKRVVCPNCEAAGEHIWTQSALRWKCSSCRKRFSVTSNTVLSKHRLSLQAILACTHLWVCGAAGKPSLETRRILGIKGYNTIFTLEAKLREAIRRGYMAGLMSGVVEIDGAHASGRRASLKRGRPLNARKKTDEKANADTFEEATLSEEEKKQRKAQARAEAQANTQAGGIKDPEYGFVYPPARRIVLTLRKRSGNKGKGAQVTRVAVGAAEAPEVVEAFIERYVAVPESILATDTGSAYSRVGERFKEHWKVNHSERLAGPDPRQHVNNSEGFTARQDRSEKGVYLNLEPKYLLDYAAETAFREDHRRLPPGEVVDIVLHYALNVGLSQDWRGFTHGKHREQELLTPAPRPAPASGAPKKRKTYSTEEGWPPR